MLSAFGIKLGVKILSGAQRFSAATPRYQRPLWGAWAMPAEGRRGCVMNRLDGNPGFTIQ
jgi:hypothetical protein